MSILYWSKRLFAILWFADVMSCIAQTPLCLANVRWNGNGNVLSSKHHAFKHTAHPISEISFVIVIISIFCRTHIPIFAYVELFRCTYNSSCRTMRSKIESKKRKEIKQITQDPVKHIAPNHSLHLLKNIGCELLFGCCEKYRTAHTDTDTISNTT